MVEAHDDDGASADRVDDEAVAIIADAEEEEEEASEEREWCATEGELE